MALFYLEHQNLFALLTFYENRMAWKNPILEFLPQSFLNQSGCVFRLYRTSPDWPADIPVWASKLYTQTKEKLIQETSI